MAPVCAKACTALVTSIRSPLISLEVVDLKAWSRQPSTADMRPGDRVFSLKIHLKGCLFFFRQQTIPLKIEILDY